MAKRKGFGQGSGSNIVDTMVAADPLRNLPTILKIEFAKALRGGKPIKRGGKERIAPRFKDGGAVPPEYKGFSKLPEEVQVKMNPQAAKKYKNGGAVMSKRGGSFKGVK